jgi:transcriptional antiterminator NusG
VTEQEETWNAVEREEAEPATSVPDSDAEPESMKPSETPADETEVETEAEAAARADDGEDAQGQATAVADAEGAGVAGVDGAVAAETEADAAGVATAETEADAAGLAAAETEAEAAGVAEPETEADAAGSGQAEAEVATGDDGDLAGRSKRRWYVIHTYSGHENKVKANLERAIQYARMQERFGEILVATEDYAVMKAGKKQITKRKTFPSYVLVEMEMDDESRALVQNIPGVTHFVGDKRPTALTEAEVRRIRGEEVREVGKVTTEVPFKVGESVKVTQGPFADFVGSVDEINLERGKLRVMVSIFGRATAVELDLTHVTSI